MKVGNGFGSKKKSILIIIFVLIVAVTAFLARTYPNRNKLIMTPSTHDKIEYLHVENARLGESGIEFALYDEECGYYEICFSGYQTFSELANLQIYADNKMLEKYSFIRNSSIWKDNTIILINDVPKFQNLEVFYNGETSSIFWEK